jgi:tripartite ATP-independent transporter DctP family solute receptor
MLKSFVALLFGVLSAGQVLAGPRDIKLAIPPYPNDSAPVQGAQLLTKKFADDKDIHISGLPPGAVGPPRAVLQSVRTGKVNMALVPTSQFTNANPNFGIFSTPFVFKDIGAVFRFQESEAGQKLLLSLDHLGLKGMDYWSVGMSQLFSNKPIYQANDLKGLKIATPPTKVGRLVMNSLGVSTVTLPSGELYAALQTGVVDGSEATPGVANVAKLHEVQKYLDVTNQQYVGAVLVINAALWTTLPDGVKRKLSLAINDVTRQVDQIAIEQMTRQVQALRNNGIEVIVPTQLAFREWKSAASKAWSESGGGELVWKAAFGGGTEGGGDPCPLPLCRGPDRTCSVNHCRRPR